MKKVIVNSVEDFIKKANLFNVKTYNIKEFDNNLCIYFSNYTKSLNNKIAGNINDKNQIGMFIEKNIIDDIKYILSNNGIRLLKNNIYEFDENKTRKITKIAGLFGGADDEFLEDVVDRKIEYEEEFNPDFEKWLAEVKSLLSDEALEVLGGGEGLELEEKYYYRAKSAYTSGVSPGDFAFELIDEFMELGSNNDNENDNIISTDGVEYLNQNKDFHLKYEYTDLE